MDQRKVGELFLVNNVANPRPTLMSYSYAMPGEENVGQEELFVYNAGDTQLTPVNVKRWKDQRLFDIHWNGNSSKLRMVRRDRTQRHLELIEVDFHRRRSRRFSRKTSRATRASARTFAT